MLEACLTSAGRRAILQLAPFAHRAQDQHCNDRGTCCGEDGTDEATNRFGSRAVAVALQPYEPETDQPAAQTADEYGDEGHETSQGRRQCR